MSDEGSWARTFWPCNSVGISGSCAIVSNGHPFTCVCFYFIWLRHSQSLTPFHPYRISSPNSWIGHLLTSWGFLTHKVITNGNGSIILLSVKTSGEWSPRLMNHWNYLHWKLREILLAVTMNINDYNRLSSH